MLSRTMVETFARVGVIAIVTVACATTNRGTTSDRASTVTQSSSLPAAADARLAPLPQRTSDLLPSTEMNESASLATVYDAVERLRPWFLYNRSTRGPGVDGLRGRPAVFVDGFFQGDAEILRTIPTATVQEVQFIRPLDAVHRYGPDYHAGVILLRTRK